MPNVAAGYRPKRQCSALTVNGTRCRFMMKNGTCPYHGADGKIDPSLGEPTNIPDAEDPEAVNTWLRRMAIEALASHYRERHGQIDHNVYKTYQTTLERLFKEVAGATGAEAKDVVAMVRGELDSVFKRD